MALGRKPAFLTVLLGFSITAPLVGVAGSCTQLTVLLSLATVFRNTGTINYVVLAETAPDRIRAFILSFLNSSVVLAYMVSALLAGVIVPRWGWRAMFYLDASCILVFLAAWLWMRETDAFQNASAHREQLWAQRQRLICCCRGGDLPARATLGFWHHGRVSRGLPVVFRMANRVAGQ